MDSYSIISSIEKYKKNINDSDKQDTTTVIKESKVNKLTEINMSSILYTNEQYKKKMNKSTKEITYETFKSNAEFDNFIDEDILNTKKKLSWKTMPIKWKIDLCKSYINNDESLDHSTKSVYLEKLSQKSDIFDTVKYNKASGTITNIDYNLF